MANKTRKAIKEKIEKLSRYKFERLIRMPSYRKDYKKWKYLVVAEDILYELLIDDGHGAKKLTKEVRSKYVRSLNVVRNSIRKMLIKYDASFMPNPDKSEFRVWGSYNMAVAREYQAGDTGAIFSDVSCQNPKLFKIDIWRDKEIIKHEMFEWIDREREKDRKNGRARKISDRVSSPSLVNRYFTVLELREKKWTYDMIVDELKTRGYYEQKTHDKAKQSARQDKAIACKLIGIIQRISRSTFGKKPTIKVSDAKKCKDLAMVWEKVLQEYGLNLNEVLSEKDGKAIIIGISKDGPVKEKLKDLSKTELEIKMAALARIKRKIKD